MSAAVVASPTAFYPDERVVVRHVSWDTYERLLADDVGRRVPRITFDHGIMELVTPSMRHEVDGGTMTRTVDFVAATLDIPIVSAGSTTYRRADLKLGFEPDASFIVQHEQHIRGKREIDLSVDPPPDVVLELEVGRSEIDKLRLFASVGVPETWRCDGDG